MLPFLRPRAPRRPLPPVVPTGLRIYAVGDIHGCADCLARLFARIDEDRRRFSADEVLEVYLGDYVDRGPDSRGVVEMLIRRAERHPAVHVMGNHELMLLDGLGEARIAEAWRRGGGPETLAAYGVSAGNAPSPSEWFDLLPRFRDAFPATHAGFLSRCRRAFECGSYLFVHAGIRPGIPIEAQSPEDLAWIREPFLGSTADHGAIIVHGHTPVSQAEIRPNRINLDTGAYLTGRLACLVLEGNEQHLI